MTQVFVNILENAARYNDKEKPTCNVRSEKIDDSVVISFSDNGIGVSEKHLSKIFDSFYQVDMGSGRKVSRGDRVRPFDLPRYHGCPWRKNLGRTKPQRRNSL